MLRNPRQHNKKHLAFVRQLPCIVCGNDISSEPAHIRFSDSRIAKINPGVGAKPDDMFTLPLCGKCHRRQHAVGDERRFWKEAHIDPIFYALAFYAFSGDHERCSRIIGTMQAVNVLAAG